MIYGLEDVVDLNIPVDRDRLNAVQFNWHKYHSSKPIDRYACSITSIDGEDNPGINFEPLYPYNTQHGSNYTEMSFNKPTIHAKPFHNLLINFDVGRSHYLRLPPGGYFPWHRDADPTSYRLIYTISGCRPQSLVWILDDRVLQLNDNSWYYINTRKKHCLFSYDTATFAVFNIANDERNQRTLYQHMVTK